MVFVLEIEVSRLQPCSDFATFTVAQDALFGWGRCTLPQIAPLKRCAHPIPGTFILKLVII